MLNCRSIFGIVAALVLCNPSVSRTIGQDLRELYRIQDGVSDTHVEYHEVKLPAG